MSTLNGKFREYKLDNGLHVALQETPTQTIAGRLLVNYGALHEKYGEEGLAHFLEHGFMSGGTQKYDPEQADKIRGTFGSFNAVTLRDRTAIPVDMLAEDLDLYLDFTSGLTAYPRLDAVRVNEERQRVLREIADRKSSPNFRDDRDMKATLFGDHPLCYFVLGKEDVIQNTTPDDLRAFHSRGYNATNMILILVGSLHKDVDDLVAKYFGSMPAGVNTKIELPTARPLTEKVELYRPAPELYNFDNPSTSSAALDLKFLVPPEKSEDYAALQILTNVLGCGTTSRLFKGVSQRKGLAYGIGADYDETLNTGVMEVYGKIPSTMQQEAIDAVFEEMNILRSQPVSQEELDRIVRNGRYALGKSLETNEGHVSAIARKIDTGITPEFAMGEWERVTPEKLLEVAQKYLPANRNDGKYVLLVRDPLKTSD